MPRVLSVLTPDEVAALGGLPGEAIAGVLDGEGASPEHFRPNPSFAALLHEVIAKHGPTDSELQDVARAQGEGWVYVIDLRTPQGPQGSVPPEDIIGAFEVRAGQIVEGSYRPMEGYETYTSNGLVVLPQGLRRALLRELTLRSSGLGGPAASPYTV